LGKVTLRLNSTLIAKAGPEPFIDAWIPLAEQKGEVYVKMSFPKEKLKPGKSTCSTLSLPNLLQSCSSFDQPLNTLSLTLYFLICFMIDFF